MQRVSVEELKEGFFEGRIPDKYFTALEHPPSGSSQAETTRTDDKILIDVREELEYGLCYLPGSASKPRSVSTTSLNREKSADRMFDRRYSHADFPHRPSWSDPSAQQGRH